MGVEAILLHYLVVIFTLISGVELIAEIFPQEPNSDALSVRQRYDMELLRFKSELFKALPRLNLG